VAGLSKGLESGVARLPLVNNKGQKVTLKLPAQRIQLRDPDLISGFLKAGKPENPSIEKVKLPPEQNFRLGETGQEVLDKDRANCGALTIMDEAQTMISGMVIGPSVGVTFFEPVDLILGGRSYPGLHILYNIMDTVPVAFPDEEQPSHVELPQAAILGKIDPADYAIFKQTKIVLDGDVQFYEFDESTVWSRQEAIHNNVALIYEVIEPLSGGWGLHIPIKGQEVWISGGPPPTPLNAGSISLYPYHHAPHYVASELMNELKDPAYLLINQVEEDELHLFIVDYPVRRKDYTGGLGGQAAGIGNNRGGIGGGAGRNHAFIHAGSGYSSFKYQWIVMTHEIGHLLGAWHQYAESDHSGDVSKTGCAGGFYEFLCGPSIMAAIGQVERAPYFSEINDFLIWMAMDPTLSDWP
jgi:hypothetical protein